MKMSVLEMVCERGKERGHYRTTEGGICRGGGGNGRGGGLFIGE